MRYHGDDGGGSQEGIIGTVSGRIHNETSRGGHGPISGMSFFWRVSRYGSGDYEKRVPPMGAQGQEVTEGQGVGAIGRVGTRRDRERDTGKTAEKGVSRWEMAGKERMRVSDTGKMAKKGVSRTE